MSDLILIFNHTITPVQEEQAKEELGVENIVVPPQDIRTLWTAVPPAAEALVPFLQPVVSWLDQNVNKGDFVLIQGDFGACYLMVQHALKKEYIPVYSTTERKAVERQLTDGGIQVTHTFRHVYFRKYGQ